MMGVGYSEMHRGGSNFNKSWAKIFGTDSTDCSYIRNNLVQIKTGEGKSVVLAVVSIIFALNGFEVNCACYSKYLSTRDYDSFYPLFRILGLQNVIAYGTFNEIAEKKLNEDGDIRNIIQALILKAEFCKDSPVLSQNTEKRPQLLLIDEVDVFFSNSFYGQIYIPQAQIMHENISALTDYIWTKRQQKIEEQAKVSQEQKQKFPYLSLKELKETPEYKNALNLFKTEFQFLVEEAAKKMIVDVVEYQSPDHLYIVHKGEIGYENQDQISTNASIGYQTLFAYYHRHRLGEINDKVFNSKKAIGINCSTFSYAEVPLQYNIILGVTGTLETLSEPQKNIIHDVYQINHQTLSPSVHSNDESRIFNPNSGVEIIEPSEYYMILINRMGIYLESGRPVILFFEHNKSLQLFIQSENFKDKKYSYQILNELDSDQEKRVKVLKATQAKTITMSTKNFGRGTDFCCYDQKVIEAGGLVVIQTFLSEDLSEETQIRGRTGRQGTKGTYIMLLNLQDLSKFNIENIDIQNSGHYYKTLCEFRDRKLSRENRETTKNRDTLKIQHDLSIKILKNVKKIIIKDPLQSIQSEQQNDEEKEQEEEYKIGDPEHINLEKMNEYLLEMNKGITLETDQHFMKVLVLMDTTCSMGVTLQKTKNCVRAMFEEARNALREMNLSEELILMKIGGYRNYNSSEENIFQVSPEWTSNPINLTESLNFFKIQDGWKREAMEIGLQYANKEIENDQGIPLSMVIIIGDAPPNTLDEVQSKRLHVANIIKNDKKYWQKTKNYKVSTNWEMELRKIKETKVTVHSFYVLNEKLNKVEAEREKEKAYLKTEFSKLTVNEGKCAFLDIHDEEAGQKQLKDFFKYLIVYKATEINQGKAKALESVSKMEVAFT